MRTSKSKSVIGGRRLQLRLNYNRSRLRYFHLATRSRTLNPEAVVTDTILRPPAVLCRQMMLGKVRQGRSRSGISSSVGLLGRRNCERTNLRMEKKRPTRSPVCRTSRRQRVVQCQYNPSSLARTNGYSMYTVQDIHNQPDLPLLRVPPISSQAWTACTGPGGV